MKFFDRPSVSAAVLIVSLAAGLPALAQANRVVPNPPPGGNTPLPPPNATPSATPASPAAPGQNPLLESARVAFEAMTPEERKAIQDDLVWASTYTGSLDGTFGKGSFDAIVAFEAKARLKADGILEPRERAALAAEAGKQRKLAEFKVVADPRTGIRLGLPTKLLDASEARGRGTVWTRKGGAFTLSTERYAPGEADFAALYEQLRAAKPNRKVTYAVIRPGFFVVAGETETRRFYTRYGLGADGTVAGYTFGHEKTAPDADRITVAIANGFDPFPGGAPVPGPSAGGQSAGQTPAPVDPPQPLKPSTVVASGIAVAPGRVLTVSKATEACKALTVGGKPAKVLRGDNEAGLVLLQAEASAPKPLALRASPPGLADPLLVLAQAERSASGPLVAPGEAVAAPVGARSEFRVMTPLQPGGIGATVVDRAGGLVALVTGPPKEPRRIAGVVPEAAHEVVAAPAIARFLAVDGIALAAPATAGPARTAGEVAISLGTAILQVVCTH